MTISNSSSVEINVNVNVGFNTANSSLHYYVGGFVANAENSTIAGSTASLTLNSKAGNRFDYVGAVVGKFKGEVENNGGNKTLNFGVLNSTAEINVSGINIQQLGGIVGYAEYLKLDNCSVLGQITNTNLTNSTSIGGFVGTAKGSVIEDCAVDANFTIDVQIKNDVDGKYIGEIAGAVVNISNPEFTSTISNCTTTVTAQTTSMGVPNITLGKFGYLGNGVIVA